jgi:phage recombination protein Bet
MSGKESKFEIVKAKVESFCGLNPTYKATVDEDRKAILIEGEGKSITIGIEKDKVKCSDEAFQARLMSLEEDSGGFLPVPILSEEKNNIKSLVAELPQGGMLSPEAVRNFICPQATGQEIIDFLVFSNALALNPFRKEIYLIKHKDGSTHHVVGLNAFTRRAAQNSDFSHYKSGIAVTKKDSEDVIFKPGSFLAPGEVLQGGWCTVYFRSKREPEEVTVSLTEYRQENKIWRDKPCTMIEKVAKVQGLRKAFPIELNGAYTAEELGIDPAREVKQEVS